MLTMLTGHTILRILVCRAFARMLACGGPCVAKTFRPGTPRKAKMMAVRARCTVEASCTRISNIFETAKFFQLELMATTAVQENGIARPGRAGGSKSPSVQAAQVRPSPTSAVSRTSFTRLHTTENSALRQCCAIWSLVSTKDAQHAEAAGSNCKLVSERHLCLSRGHAAR